jgi:tetratricopeptide (TPR) repeat protein
MSNLALVYQRLGRDEAAAPIYQRSLEVQQKTLGPEHGDTLMTVQNLAIAYLSSGQLEKSLSMVDELVPVQRRRFGSNDVRMGTFLSVIALEMLKHRQYARAEELSRECLAIREARIPDQWSTFNAKSMLGGSLVGQAKFAEAEPLLIAGYEGLKRRESSMPPGARIRVPEALQRLVDLYTATGQTEKADEWRAKLEATTPESPEKEP